MALILEKQSKVIQNQGGGRKEEQRGHKLAFVECWCICRDLMYIIHVILLITLKDSYVLLLLLLLLKQIMKTEALRGKVSDRLRTVEWAFVETLPCAQEAWESPSPRWQPILPCDFVCQGSAAGFSRGGSLLALRNAYQFWLTEVSCDLTGVR